MKSKRQLLRFAEWVARQIMQPDFEECADTFAELACRKLFYLGIIKIEAEGNEQKWVYEWEDGDGDDQNIS